MARRKRVRTSATCNHDRDSFSAAIPRSQSRRIVFGRDPADGPPMRSIRFSCLRENRTDTETASFTRTGRPRLRDGDAMGRLLNLGVTHLEHIATRRKGRGDVAEISAACDGRGRRRNFVYVLRARRRDLSANADRCFERAKKKISLMRYVYPRRIKISLYPFSRCAPSFPS